jgi:hypothetical protein
VVLRRKKQVRSARWQISIAAFDCVTSTTAPRYLSGGGKAVPLAADVATGLFTGSAVAIVVEVKVRGVRERASKRTGLQILATEAEVTLEIPVGDRHVCQISVSMERVRVASRRLGSASRPLAHTYTVWTVYSPLQDPQSKVDQSQSRSAGYKMK